MYPEHVGVKLVERQRGLWVDPDNEDIRWARWPVKTSLNSAIKDEPELQKLSSLLSTASSPRNTNSSEFLSLACSMLYTWLTALFLFCGKEILLALECLAQNVIQSISAVGVTLFTRYLHRSLEACCMFCLKWHHLFAFGFRCVSEFLFWRQTVK